MLLNYKPIGWDKVYPAFKDKDGSWTGVFVDAFSNVVNTKLIAENARQQKRMTIYVPI